MYSLIKPLLFRLDPERAHNLVISLGRLVQSSPVLLRIFDNRYNYEAPELQNDIFGIRFQNPVGLAAGFDKNGRIIDFIASLGFGFTEVGSISNLPVDGNPKPRMFRLPLDRALINRMGLNNKGPTAFLAELDQAYKEIPVVVNIVKTHNPNIIGEHGIRDFISCYETLADRAAILVLNISCPNTAEGKTFESPEELDTLLANINISRERLRIRTPLVVKFSPDVAFGDLGEMISICEKRNVDGYEFSNTTARRDNLKTETKTLEAIGKGGVSGRPLIEDSLERVRFAFRLLKGKKPIIGVGGIDSAETAYRYIKAGASLVEVYTGLVYRGPKLCKKINKRLRKLLRKDGLTHISDAIGIDEKNRRDAKKLEQANS